MRPHHLRLKIAQGLRSRRGLHGGTQLKQAGALIVGKNATYEFAYGFPTTKSYFKPARNPWNLAYDAGGSSSGSGSSVSAGLVYASMGSCTGSIRWPAQCCGIVGLKATYGRVSRAGVYPLAWSLDHTGPLARSVKDAALMLQECAGYDPADRGFGQCASARFHRQAGAADQGDADWVDAFGVRRQL